MRLKKTLAIFLVLILFFSIDTVKAQTSLAPHGENPEKIALAKEKRSVIKELQKTNKKLEKQVEIKSKKLENILVKLPEESLIPEEILQNQLGGKMELIMDHLMQIGEVELSAWDNLKAGNNLINNHKYDVGLKKLNRAISDLEQKHEMLVNFIADLDELITFLSSTQEK
jgi:hypothetical protein